MLYLYSNLGGVPYNPARSAAVEAAVKDMLNLAIENSSRKVWYKLLYLLLAVWLPLRQQERLAAVWKGLLSVLHLPASCRGIFLHSRNCHFARAFLTASQMGPLPPAVSDHTVFAGLLKKSTDKIAWGNTQVLTPPEVVTQALLLWVGFHLGDRNKPDGLWPSVISWGCSVPQEFGPCWSWLGSRSAVGPRINVTKHHLPVYRLCVK